MAISLTICKFFLLALNLMHTKGYTSEQCKSLTVADVEPFLFKVEMTVCSICGTCFSKITARIWLTWLWFQRLEYTRIFLQPLVFMENKEKESSNIRLTCASLGGRLFWFLHPRMNCNAELFRLEDGENKSSSVLGF